MKACPSGAVISVADICSDPYGTAGSTASVVTTGEQQTATIVFKLAATTGDQSALAANKNKANAAVMSVLMVPPTLTGDIVVKAAANTTSGGRRLQSSEATVKLTVTNQGQSTVSPEQVAEQASKQIKSKDTKMTGALASLGTPDTTAGVATSVKSKTVTSLTPVPTSPTPPPTQLTPTAYPTWLPQGATFTPTAAPTAPTSAPAPTVPAQDPNDALQDGLASEAVKQWRMHGALLVGLIATIIFN
jgi:hypothetical protein